MYVLLMYMWVISAHAGGAVTSAEFTSQVKCEAAAKQAEEKFNGLQSKLYWVCIAK